MNPPTTKEILARQAADAKQRRTVISAPPTPGTAVAPANSTAVAMPDSRNEVEKYIDDISPNQMAGRLIRFDGKKGEFLTLDDGEPILKDAEFIALCDETWRGWIKFNGEGQPPDRVGGLLYGGFVMPSRESLGDNDPNNWPIGLDNKPADPWQHQILVPLQHATTRELFTFGTTNPTGRRAVGNLLRSYDRTRKTAPDEVPVVRLQRGGFNHKDERVGWVHTPMFVIIGRTERDQAAKPDTSTGGDMSDEIPF
jgi:hypothetical protein